MEPKAWHWQERLDAGGAPDEACRRQLHQIRERITYRAWLKQKRAAASNRSRRRSEAEGGGQEDDAVKQEQSEAAFREWRARKTREQREKKAVVQPEEKKQKSLVEARAHKPPSQHVNPKTKRVQRETGPSLDRSSKPVQKLGRTAREEAAAAYDAWLARVRLEDRVRRSQRRQERLLRAQSASAAHAATWKKKLVVCAYSTAPALQRL